MSAMADWMIGAEEMLTRIWLAEREMAARGYPPVLFGWRNHLRERARWEVAKTMTKTELGREFARLWDEANRMLEDTSSVRAYLLAEALHGAEEWGWVYTPLNGKAPTMRGWTTVGAPEDTELALWVSGGANLGLRTGESSGVYVVDIDSETIPPEYPETVTVQTGRGYHLYYKHVPGLRNTRNRLGEGIDTRGEGGQVVAVGSIHPETGRVYQWVPRHSPDDIQIAEMSEWMLNLLGTPVALPKT